MSSIIKVQHVQFDLFKLHMLNFNHTTHYEYVRILFYMKLCPAMNVYRMIVIQLVRELELELDRFPLGRKIIRYC